MGNQAGRNPGGNPGRGAGQGKGAKPQPITRHPLFPVLVALWFGALFGLGSLAVRIGLVEALVLKLRIDLILPFAAPPLGMKARALIALAMAITGALAGLWLGRQLGRDRQARPAAGPAQGLVASLKRAVGRKETAPAMRRRSLAIEDDGVKHWAGDIAPLPGDRPQVLSASDYDFIAPLPEPEDTAKTASLQEPATAGEAVTLDLGTFLPEAGTHAAPRPFDCPPSAEAAPEPEPEPEPMPQPERPFAPPPVAPSAETLAIAPAAIEPEPQAVTEGSMTHLDLVNQLAEAMKARRERLATARTVSEPTLASAPAPAEPEPVDETTTFFEPVRFEPVNFDAVGSAAREPEAVKPATDAVAANAVPLPRLDQAPTPETPATAPLPQMPAALRPLAFDDDDDADFDISHVPPRSIGLAPVESSIEDDEAEPDAATEDLLEDGYSSLLDLSRPVQPRQTFIRIEDPEADVAAAEPEPVVTFPGQAPRPFDAPRPAAVDVPAPASITPEPQAAAQAAPADVPRPFAAPAAAAPASIPAVLADREETERALRTALATLQRMSGAA